MTMSEQVLECFNVQQSVRNAAVADVDFGYAYEPLAGGRSMDFVDYNQLSCLSTQKRIGVLQATLVGGAFQIKVDSRSLSPAGCNGPS